MRGLYRRVRVVGGDGFGFDAEGGRVVKRNPVDTRSRASCK